MQVLQLEPTRLATFEEVSAVHDGNYVKGLEKMMQQSALQEGPAIVESAPTYVTTTSNDAALRVGAQPFHAHSFPSSFLKTLVCLHRTARQNHFEQTLP